MPRNACGAELDALLARVATLESALRAAAPTAPELLLPPLPAPLLAQLVTRPRVGVGCVLLCDAEPGRVLVGERLNSHGAGKFALPGGHVEFSASWASCASEELREECGVDLPLSAWAFVLATNDLMVSEDRHYVTFFMRARLTPSQATSIRNLEPHKCRAWTWKTWKELEALPLFVPLQNFIASGGAARSEDA